MPRESRRTTIIPGTPHHVILRGNNRRRLFSGPRDYLRFLQMLLDAQRKYRCLIHSVCLMPNHVHLMVTADDATSLGLFVKHFAQRYAQYRNKTRNGSGKLFEQRFVAIAVTDEAQLATLTAYIDLNPVRAGIVSKDALQTYRWSTAGLHLGTERVPNALRLLWTPTSWFANLGSNDQERRGAYANLLTRVLERDEVPQINRDPASPADSRRLERPDRTRAA